VDWIDVTQDRVQQPAFVCVKHSRIGDICKMKFKVIPLTVWIGFIRSWTVRLMAFVLKLSFIICYDLIPAVL